MAIQLPEPQNPDEQAATALVRELEATGALSRPENITNWVPPLVMTITDDGPARARARRACAGIVLYAPVKPTLTAWLALIHVWTFPTSVIGPDLRIRLPHIINVTTQFATAALKANPADPAAFDLLALQTVKGPLREPTSAIYCSRDQLAPYRGVYGYFTRRYFG